MNVWRCEVPHCLSSVFGVGEALSLRAIGWNVRPRPPQDPLLFCPLHRPDKIPCRHRRANQALCSYCAAELEADFWTRIMRLQITLELTEKVP